MNHLLMPVLFVLTALMTAAEPPTLALPPGVVAMVDGRPIRFGDLENELLRKEGIEELTAWVGDSLERLDWPKLADDAPVITVGTVSLSKRALAAMLLAKHGAKAREELIQLAIVEAAITRAGVVVDEGLLEREWVLTEAEFVRKMEAQGQGRMDFASFLRAKLKISPEEYRRQASFRMQAGLHELVRRQARAATGDADLQAWLDARRSRFDISEGVRIASILIPHHNVPTGALVSQAERDRVFDIVRQLHPAIASGRMTFTKTWQAFARVNDPDAGVGGDLGFIDRRGERGKPGARRVPAAVVDAIFLAGPPFPRLLPPIAHEQGAEIVLVLDRRDFRAATLANPADRERVIDDLISADLDQRTEKLLSDLRKAASITYGGLGAAAP